jgi:hypothetical protein
VTQLKITGTVTGEAIDFTEGAVVEGVIMTTVQCAPQEFIEKRRDENDAE